MIRRLWQRWRATPNSSFESINALLTRQGDSPLTVDHAVADATLDGAKRFVLGILLRDAELRAHFPHALSAGIDGEFHHWLIGGGGAVYGLTDRAETHVTQLFQEPPAVELPSIDNGLSLAERLDAWPKQPDIPLIDRLWLLIVHDETTSKDVTL